MSFLFFFLVPVMLLIFFYTRMISTIRRANTSNIRRSAYRGNSGGTTKPPDHRRQTIRMLGGWRVELQTNLFEDYPKVLQGAFSVIVKSLRNLREPSFEALLFSSSQSQAMPARPHFNVYFMTLNVKHRNE